MFEEDSVQRIFSSSSMMDPKPLEEYLNSGVSSFISEKKDPYYTIVKSNLQETYLSSEVKVDKDYKEMMVSKLRGLFFQFSEKQVFERHFIEICIDYVKNNTTALSKGTLIYLNQLNKTNKQ